MYMILKWENQGNYLTCIKNKDGSIRLFEKLKVADKVADESPSSEDLRVISVGGVEE